MTTRPYSPEAVEAYTAILAQPDRCADDARRGSHQTQAGKPAPEKVWRKYARAYLAHVKRDHWREDHGAGRLRRRPLTATERARAVAAGRASLRLVREEPEWVARAKRERVS